MVQMWWMTGTTCPQRSSQLPITHPNLTTQCRHSYSKSFAPIPPPEHPTFDLYAAIDAALQEDAGDFGDITTLST